MGHHAMHGVSPQQLSLLEKLIAVCRLSLREATNITFLRRSRNFVAQPHKGNGGKASKNGRFVVMQNDMTKLTTVRRAAVLGFALMVLDFSPMIATIATKKLCPCAAKRHAITKTIRCASFCVNIS